MNATKAPVLLIIVSSEKIAGMNHDAKERGLQHLADALALGYTIASTCAASTASGWKVFYTLVATA